MNDVPVSIRRTRNVVVAAYLIGLALLVFTPISRALNRFTVWLYVQWEYRLRLPGAPLPETFGSALNVLLFVPLGLLIVLWTRRSWLAAVGAAVACSAAIELLQLVPAIGRQPDPGDLLANTLGGLIGALLALWLRSRTDGRTP